MRWSFLTLMLMGVGTFATIAQGSGPAVELLRLVPANSGVTLVVEDLRGHSLAIRESPLFEGLGRLPAVKDWLGSDRFRMVEQTSKDVKASLGLSLEVMRDDLLGDAVVFALQPGPASQPEQAQGLFLVRPRDRELIARLVKSLNEVQTRAGELDRVEPRSRGAMTYMVRRFKHGQRPPETYIQLDDGIFAWSNSEAMIHGVIDRKLAVGTGLGDDPRFQKVRQGLPERALLSLFVNPRLLERLLADPSRSSKTPPDRFLTMVVRYLGAVTQVGFAVQWREGFVLHSHELLDPDKLDGWLKRWLTRPPGQVASFARIPSTAVAVLAANLDFESLAEAAGELVPEPERASFANFRLLAQGIFLGHDPMTWVLPRLNSSVLAYFDVETTPTVQPSFPWVAVVGWPAQAGPDNLAAPVDNALRTLFAMIAVDPKHREEHYKVETKPVENARLTLLSEGVNTLLAYRSDNDQLVIGNSSTAVARFAGATSDTHLAEIRAKYVGEAETFAVVDAQRLALEGRKLQKVIAQRLAARSRRTVVATERDLVQVLDLASLFRAFTFSIVTTKDATEIHRAIGLIAR